MSREALVLLVCCCDFRDGAEWLIPSKSLRNAVIWAFPGLLCILRMCAPRRAAAVVRPRGREKSADRRRRILISRLLIIRASVPRWKSPFPAYFKGFPAVSPLIPPYPAFLKYPVSPHLGFKYKKSDKTLTRHSKNFTYMIAFSSFGGNTKDSISIEVCYIINTRPYDPYGYAKPDINTQPLFYSLRDNEIYLDIGNEEKINNTFEIVCQWMDKILIPKMNELCATE